MDWDTLIAALVGALIGISSSLITLFVNHYFQRKHDDRKRKWELEDRAINRHLEFRDINLKHAQELLDSYFHEIQELCATEILLIHTENIEALRPSPDNESEKIKLTLKQISSLTAFDNIELGNLAVELASLYNEELENRLYIMSMIESSDDFDKQVLVAKVREFGERAISIMSKIQVELDKLTETAL